MLQPSLFCSRCKHRWSWPSYRKRNNFEPVTQTGLSLLSPITSTSQQHLSHAVFKVSTVKVFWYPTDKILVYCVLPWDENTQHNLTNANWRTFLICGSLNVHKSRNIHKGSNIRKTVRDVFFWSLFPQEKARAAGQKACCNSSVLFDKRLQGAYEKHVSWLVLGH